MRTFSSALIIFLLSAHCLHASEIRAVEYEYRQQVASFVKKEGFVICDDCSGRKKLSRMPLLKTISIRVVEEEKQQDTQEKPVSEPAQTLPVSRTKKPITVHFDFNSAILKDEEKSKIKGSFSEILSAGEINLTGYTCNIGTKAYNDHLALRRAHSVADYLESLGVSRKKISVDGKGKCCYISTNRKLNRRVEITLEGGKP